MAIFNITSSGPSTFILNGIPGLETVHIWISIPFSAFYISCLLANSTVLFVVIREQTLHKPMYLLICMLTLTDMGLATSVMPRALCIFWFGFREITVDGCFTQMFFFYAISGMHSAILVIMAFDRYVAIAEPLRYPCILTNARTVKLGLLGFARGILSFLPLTLLLWRLPLCANRIIQHTYCEHMAVLKLFCVDTTVNRMYSLVALLVFNGLDVTIIGLSYGLILKAVFRISTNEGHQKVLNTCTSHICVIVMSYTSAIFTSLTHRFGHGIGADVHIILANLYILIPPMLNPIIYGIKTKELRKKVGKYFSRM